MTWADIIATGSGECDYRLVIEGAKYQFVESDALRGTLADGRKRVVGLQREGLGFIEKAYLAGAESNVSINPARIVETPEPDINAATEIFSKIPAVQAWLGASLSASATSATMLDATDLDVDGHYHIGTEVIRVTAKVGEVATIERGQWGTTAQAHNITNATSALSQQVPLIDGIEIWAKRRWWLYAHGPTETDVTDEGTLIMRGVIGAEPEEAEGEWTIALDSRLALLDQEVAAAADTPRSIRGIYYPATAPFYFLAAEGTTSTLHVLLSEAISASTPTTWESFFLSGFWETQGEFCFALQEALNNHPVISTWATWRVVAFDGRWELYFRTPSSDPRWIHFHTTSGSPVDGSLRDGPVCITGGSTYFGHGDTDVTTMTALAADTEYLVPWGPFNALGGVGIAVPPVVEPANLRRVPRTSNFVGPWSDEPNLSAHPAGRQYLDNVIGLAVGDALLVPQGAEGEDVPPRQVHINAVSPSAGYVEAYADSTIANPSGIVTAGGAAPELATVRAYVGADGGNLYDFVQALVDAAPDGANDASTPWITEDDIALAAWALVIGEVSTGHAYLARRSYTFSKGQRLEDVIKQECRMYGVFPYVDHDFKISVRRLTVETAEVASGLHINRSLGTHVDDDRNVEIRSGADGNVNVYELSREYDQQEDKYLGAPVSVVDDASVARGKARRVLEVRPKTRAAEENGEPTWEDAVRMSAPVRAMFGGKIIHSTVDVPITFWDVLVGDSVLLTDETAPYDGARGLHDPGQGLSQRRAITVGREWRFDDAAGTLTCLTVGLDVAGYTPSARVDSASGADGDWTLTVETNHYAPVGAADASYFFTNDRIRLVEWDATTPTVHLGSVISVSGDDIEVQLETPWAGPASGSGIWNLAYAPCDDGLLSAEQLRYAFIASSTRRLDDGATTRNARLFAP